MPISRNTRQKQIIDEEIKKFKIFFSSEELLNNCKVKDTKLGIATIYRYLKTLKQQGKIYSYQCDKKTIYSNKKRSHCHYICDETGKSFHFDIESLDFLKGIVPGDITSIQLEVRGICKKHDHK